MYLHIVLSFCMVGTVDGPPLWSSGHTQPREDK
jgi:hypothetical protein